MYYLRRLLVKKFFLNFKIPVTRKFLINTGVSIIPETIMLNILRYINSYITIIYSIYPCNLLKVSKVPGKMASAKLELGKVDFGEVDNSEKRIR